MSFIVRESLESDRTFIIDSMLSSYRTSHTAGIIPVADFHRVMWPVVEELLARPGMRVCVMAGSDGGDGDVVGWLAFEKDNSGRACVFYVFVKQAYRRAGCARALFEAAGIDPEKPFAFVCKTGIVAKLVRKFPCAKWQPLLARYPKERSAA